VAVFIFLEFLPAVGLISVKYATCLETYSSGMQESLDQAGRPLVVAEHEMRKRQLITVVADLVRELHPQRIRLIDVAPSSRIERDLGIDSLGRTELILRIERAFRVRLPAQTIGESETVQDLVQALEQARPTRVGSVVEVQLVAALPSVSAASDARTLIEVLEWHAARHPERLHLTVLQDEATTLGSLTYAELATKASALARGLVARDVAPGDRVALMLPTSIEFFTTFFGILYAGAIPVPIYPPMRISQLEDHLRRQVGILRNASACLLVTMPEGRRLAGLLRGQVETLKLVESAADLEASPPLVELPRPSDADTVALIQYTSGSTGDPKGVVLTHANLLANIRAMGQVMDASSTDIFVSWLPLYHDMGLIGAWLGCLHFAAPLYVMSPLSFLVRPESWLRVMHRFHATFSASPNFGFELCINKIAEEDLVGLDLSSLRMIANGAEPVSAHTVRRFIDRFAQYGFPASAMAPVYGLAECSVGLAFPPPGRPPLIDRVNYDQLSRNGIAEPAKPDDPKPFEIVASGQPLPGHEIRVVDEAGHEFGDRREGRLEFRGPSTTRGYFRNETKTRELFNDGWLNSGDLAYVAGGDVYITGRVKDIIIRAGRHLYPQEIEEAVAEIPGIRKGGVAVFSVSDSRSGTERVIVLAETRELDATTRATLQKRAHEVTTDVAGTPPDEIVLAPPRTVPKTSSGKIRRSAAKELYESGHIGPSQRALWLQVLRLSLAGVAPQLTRMIARSGDVMYAGWWWAVVGPAFLLAWLAVMVIPRLSWRWSIVRAIARRGLTMIGVPISVIGLDRIPKGNSMLVFNHASYADLIVLAAILPGEPLYVAKRELAGQFFAGPFLRRLGVLFVERYDVSGRLADTEAVVAGAQGGRNVVFFPEGTFTRRPGLSAFYLGAFKVAADAGLPILPGVICGTRTILRSDQWFPRWSPVRVQIEEAIRPPGSDFASLIQLRDAVRNIVLTHCGEPDIAELVKPGVGL
jgi:1-acyl-sn-glycerol-3-phosphate acyltransferase